MGLTVKTVNIERYWRRYMMFMRVKKIVYYI